MGREEIDDTHRFSCDICQDTNYCPSCYIAAEGNAHIHKLQKIPLAERGYEVFRYSTNDEKQIIVGNYVNALPGNRYLRRNQIKSVLSIIQFPNPNKQTEPLRLLFRRQESYVTTTDARGAVVYHHISIPDVAFPSLLKEWNAQDYFERCSTYISERLVHGNVYVHCEKGQRRSPTAVIAWMVTQGMSPEQALAKVGKEYEGDESWHKSYIDSRPKWIEELVKWGSTWKSRMSAWREKNRELLELWQKPAPVNEPVPCFREKLPQPLPPPKASVTAGKNGDEGPTRPLTHPTNPMATSKRRRVLEEDDDDDEVGNENTVVHDKKRPRSPSTETSVSQPYLTSSAPRKPESPSLERPPPAKVQKCAPQKTKGLLAFFSPQK